MDNSAQQIHEGKTNVTPQKGNDVRLYVDLDVCSGSLCKECVIKCSYLYHRQNQGNNGITSIRELATYFLVCRRCEEPHCVAACPREALEQQKDKNKLLIRHNMRCVSCKSCSHACPYGTIYPESVPFLIHACDFCLDRRNEKDEPLCIKTCPYSAVKLVKADSELDKNTFLAGDNLIVHSIHWDRDKA